jgi:diguanylate cyclase (GGDEF)-like protein/PAS domain S-box-containing protein
MAESTIGSRLELILDTMTDGVYVVDEHREIVYWSAGAERITGYPAGEVVGKHCYDNVLVHADLHGKQLCYSGCPLENCIKTGGRHSINEVFLKRKDGERLAVYVKTATFEEDGVTFGVEIFGELESVAGQDLATRVQELSETSITDPLSGLFNRRYFDAALQQQYDMFRNLGRRYGVMHIDVDHFKNINDTLGHATGDDAIRFIASVLSRNARKMDVVARYGGDEFAVICSVATQEELEGYGRRLIMMVHESQFAPAAQAGTPLTISVGGALVNESDPSARTTVERADEAMYAAKNSGRDGLIVATND